MTRSYQIRTYGCQMNVHDSERLAGMLEDAGYVRAGTDVDPDVVVFNTCAVRENADNRLYGNLGHLRPAKDRNPGMQIAVGGCLAQKDRGEIVKRAPWVDVVFGTHNLGSLPTLLERARHNEEAEVEILESLDVFPSTLPARRESAYSGWVSVSVGCNNTCTFCIVPALRGKEKDRRPGEILSEVQALVSEGVLEVTLLGQNVNAYGVEFGDRFAFGKLLRSCGEIEGLERVRFTSPHPRDFTDDVIAAMAETPNVCHQLHMPLQSGSDRVLKQMRRSYRSQRYLDILRKVREAMPDAAITTDIIVGFPGETEEDFEATMQVVREARFASAFTFQYSKRPGTPAAEMEGQLPKEVVQQRYDRLIELQNQISWDVGKELVGRSVELLVAEGEGRKDTETHRLSGRARDGRLVHFTPVGAVDGQVRPGDVVHTTITRAAPHHLVADSEITAHRRTRAGDHWEEGVRPKTSGVSLGLPSFGAPPAQPAAQQGCAC
ncbi:tRNA-i(6)A37 thiotransferase enzyme MiaB [Saccharopolyspora erythraea NRRL 2338]|uniref:tRNA-2-methylthio-N(6)-dimethylallyladenosine synthase n=2 Tax=Saccharopolyspora erythraea TaxID=1836 RepID=MIAB_SACEN|nr:tRNA (N6-isopentenyl adenosine(37)-C2)-methylthiotransferase MiaB [Saccharopolyspora erythraea]A4FAJ1.1 RecName: Full=tRNA-2-methylthio-N(6)-dimethylallyladenosine synthase; AltName: Full=(Dimethylallyl)adenosine tRNA methylthiotransferase MiaB; AltName: Full=tRNA-i(6)A37 methylthiotransferase [Saccharopolyspora erythraea NRRL 2338]EQD82790.1 (dimethylallyl)adenosine tRNA methylthiotransferase [Saccharopolyspora erythraea D]PFG94853.1 tRNA-i(6)A37 thiotransferase enzyme MiaB [Saccharopolyspor